MKNTTLLVLLLLTTNPVFAKPPANDSVHGGTGRQLLDNITPNALGGGSDSGGGKWTGYEHLKGRELDTGWFRYDITVNSKRLHRGMARVDANGSPYVRCMGSGDGMQALDTNWIKSERCGNGSYYSPSVSLTPRGLSVNNLSGIPW